MILKRLIVNRLPGIHQPFEIEAAGPGIHVIFGPNGIGKSSICRAVGGLYWEDRGPSRETAVSGEFEWDGETWRAERESSRVRWSRGGEGNLSPNLPASHNYRCFFLSLRDLIDLSQDGSEDIASEIRRQMSGGFDLGRIASDMFSPVTRRRERKERDSYNKASESVERAVGKQSDLQQRVDKLRQLKWQLEEAEIAAGRLASVGRAVGLASRRSRLTETREQLGALPGALANLTGKERDAVEQYQERLSTLKERARVVNRELHGARRQKKESRLAVPMGEADLPAWRGNADKLERIELTLETARAERAAARSKLAAAVKTVGGEDTSKGTLSLPEHAELFKFLRDSHSHAARVDAIEERLNLLQGVDPPERGEQDLDGFHNAAEALRAWLRVPQPESIAERLRNRWPWLLLAGAMLAAGATLASLFDPSLAFVAAVGAGIGLAALFPGGAGDSWRRRKSAETACQALELEEPIDWDVPGVESALRRLESQTAKLEASRQRSRDRDVERKLLENRRDALTEDNNRLKTRRQDLQASLGLEKLLSDAQLVDLAQALDQLRLARGEYEAARSKVESIENSHASRLAALAEYLEQHGEPPPGAASEAKARLDSLADRNARLENALANEHKAKRQLEENAADQESTLTSITRIYAGAELEDGDLHGLRSLLEALPEYHDLTGQITRLESQIELDRAELEKAGEAELSARDGPSLDKLKAEFEDAASQAEQLRGAIAHVTAQVNQARGGHDLRDLITAREEARANLRDRRDQALFSTSGNFLIDEVEQEYEQTRMPRVFELAREHFSSFTSHNYELHLEKGNGTPRLFAIELQGGQRRELHELSDGTRTQLLLAARIAFAEEVERGKMLPLFLDEALDQSDPQRFEAIARSLGSVARDQGRQIFYLTSDPLDVDRIRHALSKDGRVPVTPIDLGLIRTGAESVGGPEELRVPPAPDLPSPDGLTPEAYGALLRVPAFRPALGYTQQHIFYVLWDDLALLRGFLANAIERAGQWQTVAGTSLAERLASRSITATQVGLRLELLEVFCELWKQGRGRPVDRDALEDSGALTGRYLDDVVEIAKELDGDPERLLDMLARRGDERLQGFRARSVERLRSYLVDQEYLDGRPVFTESELQLRCLASPAANALPGNIASECARGWWQWAGKSSASGPKSRQG